MNFKNLIYLLFTPMFVQAQTTDTINLCIQDTVCFINWQYENCQPTECGHIITVVDSNSVGYKTIPTDYVFEPPYQIPFFEEKYCIDFTHIGTVKIKITDYDFYTGSVKINYVDIQVGSCRDTIVRGDDTTIVIFPIKNGERSRRPFYMPSIFNSSQTTLYPFTSVDYDILIKSMRIYDTGGNLVYEVTNMWTNEPSFGWNGNSPAGVYVWEIQTLTYKRTGVVILAK